MASLMDYLSGSGGSPYGDVLGGNLSPTGTGLLAMLGAAGAANPPQAASRLPLAKPSPLYVLSQALGAYPQGYGAGLQQQGLATQNKLNALTLQGYLAMQQANGMGAPTAPAGIASAMQPQGMPPQQPPPQVPPANQVPLRQNMMPPGPPMPNPGPQAAPPGPPPGAAPMPPQPPPQMPPQQPPAAPPPQAGAQPPPPLFNMPSIAAQYRVASSTPGMQPVASSLLSLIEKGTPEGSYVDVNGGIQARPGFQNFTQQSAASKAAGSAPYDIAKELASQAGRAVEVSPGSTAFTGLDRMDPVARQVLESILSRGNLMPSGPVSAPGGSAGTAAAQRMAQGGPRVDANGFPKQPTTLPGGGLQTPLTLQGAEMQKKILPAQFEEAQKDYQAAQSQNFSLDMIDHAVELLNQSGWSSTGSGAALKLDAMKGLNSVATSVGLGTPFDASKISNFEDLNKEATRMGFALAKTLGSRESQMIVQQAVSAVPNANNTYMGARLVSSSLRQAAQRNMDYYEYLQNFAMQHGGTTMGADIAFNKANPVGTYTDKAILTAVPPAAIDYLKKNPMSAPLFDQQFGKKGLANMVLGAPQ